MRRWRTALVVLALSLPSIALAQRPLWPGEVMSPSSVEPSPEATAQALRAMHWKHQLDITLARHAVARAKQPAVRRFAKRILTDHQLAEARLLALATELGVDMRPPAAEEQAQTERVQELVSELQDQAGEAFEQAWLRMVINDNRQHIQKLARLRPRVDNDALRDLMGDYLPIVHQHLAMARSLRSGEEIGVFRTGSSAPLWIQFITQAWR